MSISFTLTCMIKLHQWKKFAEHFMKSLKTVKLSIGPQATGMQKQFFKLFKFVKNTIFISQSALKTNIICSRESKTSLSMSPYIQNISMDW
jgi:hypothetical protein